MSFFGKKKEKTESLRKDFEYLSENDIYLDSACQTLRPQPIIDSVNNYFNKYNACGGRVKYDWGKQVDEEVEKTREKVLGFVGKTSKDYSVAFTLNTTYGLNLILQQLPAGKYSKIITSDIEHNSVFLSTITASKRLNIDRKIFSRNEDGSLSYKKEDLAKAIVVLNAVSNIDGRVLQNIKEITKDVHEMGGIFIVDGAQSMIDGISLLREIDFDALCFSSHKMYGPSLGVIVVKKELVSSLDLLFVGGGMVEKLDENSFTFPSDDISCRLEAGLQDFAGIIGLGASLDWLTTYKPEGLKQIDQKESLTKFIFEKMTSLSGVKVLNLKASTTLSFYSEDIDSHRLATFFSEQNIMTRSGYFCCHYYLQNVKKYPPLLRISLGLHNTEKDVDKFVEIMEKIIKNIK